MKYEFTVGQPVEIMLPAEKYTSDLNAFEWVRGSVVAHKKHFGRDGYVPMYVVHGTPKRAFISHVTNGIRAINAN